jgi:acetyltransferase-like isoleucine patch superfamily enzyme
MIVLEALWWAGWIWFVAWAVLPLALAGITGPLAAIVLWAVLAPWSALFGMALAHRLLPAAEPGRFRMFADRGSVSWALKGWAPALYLAVFQPVFFLSPAFGRVALRAFGARLGAGAQVTTRTSIREPHLVTIGRGSLVGEFAHLVCSHQPKPHTLVVAPIAIGDEVLIGGYSVLGAGSRVGSRSILEYRVSLGPHATVGEDSRIGAGTTIRERARIGHRVRLGKGCSIGLGAVVADDTRLPDGSTWPAAGAGA